jgi:hypothetical protein
MSQLDVSIELLTGGEAMHLESSSDDTRVSLAQLIPHLDKLHAPVLYTSSSEPFFLISKDYTCIRVSLQFTIYT